MVHYQTSPIMTQQQHHIQQHLQQQHHLHQQQQHQQQQQQQRVPQEELVGLTVEEAGIEPMALPEEQESSNLQEFLQEGCVRCASAQDKENQPPTYHTSGELTYLDLDKTPNILKERSNCLKRRRAVTEWETEEAVQSILPKRRCTEEGDDSVFLDDATILSDTVSKELEQQTETNSTTTSSAPAPTSPSSMEIDRITSLVSIFSFGLGEGKLSRSVSTPDLCSSQAKDVGDSIQQRPFLAMTV